jgi:hypothetical protein
MSIPIYRELVTDKDELVGRRPRQDLPSTHIITQYKKRCRICVQLILKIGYFVGMELYESPGRSQDRRFGRFCKAKRTISG